MKAPTILLTLILLLAACTGGKTSDDDSSSLTENKEDRVEILYFHGDMRCKNCYAMEKGVSELLDDEFKDDVKDGKIIFKTIDITTPEGEKIADNYGVTWSSLFLNNWKGGKEERNDLTRMGMQTAAKDPVTFKNKVAELINKYHNP